MPIPCPAESPAAADEPPRARMARVDALAAHRRLLLLQGPNGPFFHRLTRRLRALGAEATRVTFNAGDDLFHPRRDALAYRGTAAQWPAYLEALLRERGIAAIVLFGQDRPLHRLAIEVAKRLGVAVVVFEEGYVRPCWITMEYGGVNGCSALMQPLSRWADDRQPPPRVWHERFTAAFQAMAFYTFAYGLWGVLFRHRYPLYEHHKPLRATELLHWLRGAVRRGVYALRQHRLLRRLAAGEGPPFFLVPLQVSLDSQITHHSDWDGVEPFIRCVLQSFAAHAPPDHRLVFKHHPLDIGHAHYGRCIRATARALGIAERVRYVHGGRLPLLLAQARGVVVVNSTVGLQALHHGTPVKVCGRAIYDKPGLTDPRSLDVFWQQPHAGHAAVYQRFLRSVLARSQVNASFYAPAGNWSAAELRRRPGVDEPASLRDGAAAMPPVPAAVPAAFAMQPHRPLLDLVES